MQAACLVWQTLTSVQTRQSLSDHKNSYRWGFSTKGMWSFFFFFLMLSPWSRRPTTSAKYTHTHVHKHVLLSQNPNHMPIWHKETCNSCQNQLRMLSFLSSNLSDMKDLVTRYWALSVWYWNAGKEIRIGDKTLFYFRFCDVRNATHQCYRSEQARGERSASISHYSCQIFTKPPSHTYSHKMKLKKDPQ